jgi:hypothetical protein
VKPTPEEVEAFVKQQRIHEIKFLFLQSIPEILIWAIDHATTKYGGDRYNESDRQFRERWVTTGVTNEALRR